MLGGNQATAGLVGGMLGGIAQAYTTMGFCTFMKTVEVTRSKSTSNLTTMQVARQVFQKEGIRGLNKGVNAVALRQMTNWGSRFGFFFFLKKIFFFIFFNLFNLFFFFFFFFFFFANRNFSFNRKYLER